LHGGVLASLCDNAMGLSLAASLTDPSLHIVTINLSVDYLDGAKLGDMVVIEPRVVRAGR
jgi:acyl-coenzyme A thioesterase PaaI-like protein